MLDGLIRQAQDAAATTARKATFSAGGILCLVVGLGFLTAAVWLLLVELTTVLNAALILGAAYVGVGLVLLAVARMKTNHRQPKETPKPPEQTEMVPQLITAFMTGVEAGQKARS